MNSLPTEVRGLIYYRWATNNLRNLCKHYSIHFENFCAYLIDHKAVIYGSLVDHCWGKNQDVGPRLFIFFFRSNNNHLYHFNQLFEKETPFVNWETDFSGMMRSVVVRENLWYELISASPGKFSSAEDFLSQTCIIDQLSISFDGLNWHTLELDLVKIVENRTCRIIRNLGSCAEAFVPRFPFDSVLEKMEKIDKLPTDIQTFLRIWCPPDHWEKFIKARQAYRELSQRLIDLENKPNQKLVSIYDSLIQDLRLFNHKNFLNQVHNGNRHDFIYGLLDQILYMIGHDYYPTNLDILSSL